MTRRTLLTCLLGSALLAGGLSACTPDGPAEPQAPSPSSTPTPTGSSTPSPTPTPEPTPTPTPDATTVALSAAGVGDLAWDAPDATSGLTALLGPPQSVDAFPVECGLQDTEVLRWGGVTVAVQAGALLAWQVDERGPVPQPVTVPDGLALGAPLSSVAAVPGALQVVSVENYGVYQVQVTPPGSLASVFYWFDSDAADSPVTTIIGRYLLGCG